MLLLFLQVQQMLYRNNQSRKIFWVLQIYLKVQERGCCILEEVYFFEFSIQFIEIYKILVVYLYIWFEYIICGSLHIHLTTQGQDNKFKANMEQLNLLQRDLLTFTRTMNLAEPERFIKDIYKDNFKSCIKWSYLE
ncbi:unnamed protein product [Paramecium octaurelia]|uniref:Uncharacterized protein n=1 Tax=Paramecium octaurelia TaxID=43137 RepID=A0A8S1VGF4_PAROT|nr:unnamed protein product [Paramecium octaurelia]